MKQCWHSLVSFTSSEQSKQHPWLAPKDCLQHNHWDRKCLRSLWRLKPKILNRCANSPHWGLEYEQELKLDRDSHWRSSAFQKIIHLQRRRIHQLRRLLHVPRRETRLESLQKYNITPKKVTRRSPERIKQLYSWHFYQFNASERSAQQVKQTSAVLNCKLLTICPLQDDRFDRFTVTAIRFASISVCAGADDIAGPPRPFPCHVSSEFTLPRRRCFLW